MQVEELLQRNETYRKDFAYAEHSSKPTKKLAIVACMDCRSTVANVFQLKQGEAIVIRTAGGTVDEGVIRSLVVATNALGVEHIVVMGHDDCGMQGVGVDPEGFAASIGADPRYVHDLLGFTDPVENVRIGLERVRSHPYIHFTSLHGLLYHNETGKVELVQ
jgi:carbonic anhydrase